MLITYKRGKCGKCNTDATLHPSVIICPGVGQVLQEVAEIRNPLKMLVALLWVVTMVLYWTGTRETVSPGSSSRTAEPDVIRKPSDVSHRDMCICSPFISFKHT